MKTRRTSTGGEEFDPKADYRAYERVQTPPWEYSPKIVPIIDKTLAKCQVDERRAFVPPAREGGGREKYCLHPSQSAGCRRKVQFIVLNARKDVRPPDSRLERVFDMGHELHRLIQGYLFEAWRRKVEGVTRVWEDVKLKVPHLGASGELDAIIELFGKYRAVVEVKTAGINVFAKLTAPKVEWVWQAHLYMAGVGLRHAILLVMCRDNGRMMEFSVPWDDDVWDQIEDQAFAVWSRIEESRVIDANPEVGECMWCNYKQLCNSRRLQKSIQYEKAWRSW